MKNLNVLLVVIFLAIVGVMPAIHWQQSQGVRGAISAVTVQADRYELANEMLLSLEKYRRENGQFRKLGDAQESQIKNRFRDNLQATLAKLDKLSPDAREKGLAADADKTFTELQVQSTKLEPTLFLKDVYVKEPIQKLHETLVSDFTELAKSARAKMGAQGTGTLDSAHKSLEYLVLAALAATGLLVLVMMRNYFAWVRPFARFKKRIFDIREGRVPYTSNNSAHHNTQPSVKPLTGDYGAIEAVMKDLAATVEMQRTERHQFITAVAMDLRAPLVKLQSGVNFLASVGERLDDNQRFQAIEVVKRSLFKISRTLDDLNDIIETDSQIRLDEKIIDLRTTLNQVSEALGGASATHQISVAAPAMPIWGSVDVTRFERVIVNLVSKMMQFQPHGGKIHLSLIKPSHGSFQGVEIAIQDGSLSGVGRGAASGPEVELLRHWVSENGFGMSLAQKIIRAHGGTITASGVAGTQVMFTIRIPQERVSSGLISTSLTTAPVGSREMNRIAPMFPQEAVIGT